MRRITGVLIWMMAATWSQATTVYFPLAQLTGSASNRKITLTLASQGYPLAIGSNIVFNTPLVLQPVGGMATITNLLPANYWVAIDQVTPQMFMPVPDSTNVYNAVDLITQGLRHLIPPVTNWFSINGVILYDPILQTLAQGTATNVYSYWHGKSTNGNWKFYNPDGYTQSTTNWTYPLDFSGLASGTLNAAIQTNFLDDIALITRQHGITANHSWAGYPGMPVIFNVQGGGFSTNYVAGYTNPIPGVDLELVTFSNAAPVGVNPFWLLPSNAVTCLPTNIMGGQVIWMRNNAGNAGAPHMDLIQAVIPLDGGYVGCYGNPDPLNPFYDGAATGGDSGSAMFVALQNTTGAVTPVFMASVWTPTEGPWVSYSGYLPTIQGLIGTNQLQFVDITRYQNAKPTAPANGSTNVFASKLPVTANLLRTDGVLVEKDLGTGAPTTQIIDPPDFLEVLTNLTEWAAAVAAGGGSGGGGLDIRPLNNVFRGTDTFSNTVTMGGAMNSFGISQHFGDEYFEGDANFQGHTVRFGISSDLGAYGFLFAGFGAGSHTNGTIYTFPNGPITIYAGSNMDSLIGGTGTFANPILLQDNNIFAGGGGLSNLNGSAISTGTIPPARIPALPYVGSSAGAGTNNQIWYSFAVTNPVYGTYFFVDPTNNAFGLVQTNGNKMVWTNGVLYGVGTNTLVASNFVATGWAIISNSLASLNWSSPTNAASVGAFVQAATSGASPVTAWALPATNTITQAGVVTPGSGHANQVWGTDGSGNPGWVNPSSASLPAGTNGGDGIFYHGGSWVVLPAGEYYFSGTSTNASPTNLAAFATGKQFYAVPNGYSARIRGDFEAAGATNTAGWTKVGQFRNDNGTLSLLQSNQIAGPSTGQGTNWNCQYIASSTNILVEVIGDTNETVGWAWEGKIELLTNATQVSSATTNLITGLVAYYRFEDGSAANATDASGNSRTLTQHNSPQSRTGKLNNAIGYNGSNTYFDRADEAGMRFTADFTISCWVWMTNATSNFQIITKDGGSAPNREFNLRYQLSSGFFVADLLDQSSTLAECKTTTLPGPASWIFVLARRSGSTLSIWYNGTQQGTASTAGLATIGGTSAFTVGALTGGTTILNGAVDELGFWNRALSSTEISELYNSGAGRDPVSNP